MVASGRACRCSMNAAISRIGPSTLVVTTASAEARNAAGLVPVLDPHDAGHGDQHVEVGMRWPAPPWRRDAMLAGVGRVDPDGVDAGVLGGDPLEQFGAAAADDDGVAPGLQREREGEADAAGGAGDEDGVSCDVHASSLSVDARRGAESGYRGIGDPWFARAPRQADTWTAWTAPHSPTSCAGAARRCARRTSGCPPGARRRDPRTAPRGGRRAGRRCRPTTTPGWSSGAARSRASRCSPSLARALRLTADERDYLFRVAGHNTPDRLAAAGARRPGAAAGARPARRHPGARSCPTWARRWCRTGWRSPCSATSPATPAWPAARSTAGSPIRPSGCATPRTTATGRAAPRSPTCAPPTGRWARGRGPASSCGRCSQGQPGVRRAVGAARGRPALRGPQDAAPPRARRRSRWTARCCSPRTSRRRLLVLTAPPRTEGYEKLQLLAVLGTRAVRRGAA